MVLTAEVWSSDVDELRRCGAHLFAEHFAEVALDQDVVPLNINWKGYYELEERGQMVSLAAWQDDDLVGYSCSQVSPHLQHADTVVLQNHVIFVTKDRRKGGLGKALILHTIDLAIEHSAGKVAFHAKQGSAMARILPRLGFELEELLFSKVI